MSFSSRLLIGLFLLFLAANIVVSLTWYTSSRNTATVYLKTVAGTSMLQTEKDFDGLLTETDNFLTLVTINEDAIIQPILNLGDQGRPGRPAMSYESLQNLRRIRDYVESINGYKSYIAGIGVYSTGESLFQTSSLVHSTKALLDEIQSLPPERLGSTMIVFSPVEVEEAWIKLSSRYVIPVVRPVFDHYRNLIGYVAMYLDYSFIERLFTKNLPDESRFQVADGKDRLVFSNCGDTLISAKTVGPDFLFSSFGLRTADWTLLMALPSQSIMSDIEKTFQLSMVLMLLVSAASLLIGGFIISVVNRRVTSLCQSIARVGAGDFTIRKPQHNDEFGRIHLTVNQMILQIEGLMAGIAEKERQKSLQEISFLQAQINPHFIANTLNTISWMAKVQHAESIVPIANSLNTLLRSAMKSAEDLIPLRDELELTQSYIDILLRSGNHDFAVGREIQPETESLLVPRFLLLPLVENAVYHGFSRGLLAENKLTFRAALADDRLEVVLEDNGKGMTPQEIARLTTGPQERTSGFNGIGVVNVAARIRLSFGEAYGLRFESLQGELTQAIITLPQLRPAT